MSSRYIQPSGTWEDTFAAWAKPPGRTEQQRCENAEKTIRNAIARSEKLKNRNITVFAQGSYANRVNVRKDSDVDIGILCHETFFFDLPQGSNREHFSIEPASYQYAQFKNEVGEALVAHFGQGNVARGNKAFEIRENSYHVEADVAPFFEHHRYDEQRSHITGVELSPDNGGRIMNWPDQHYENGVAKNKRTNHRFKALVRILKSLRNTMDDAGVLAAKPIPGFFVECLVWNVPNSNFGNSTYSADVRAALAHLFNNTMNDEQCSEWGEVSELKYLFRGQRCTRQEAHAFISAAWDCLGLQ